jgi:hypothetical protein
MPETPARPGTVTFVAIVLIILGSISLLSALIGVPWTAYIALSPEPPAPPPNQPPDIAAIQRFLAKEVPGFYAVTLTFAGLDLLFGLGELLSGIGLLKLKPRARAAAFFVILGKLLLGIGANTYQGLVVLPVQNSFIAKHVLPAGQQAPFDISALMGGISLVAVGVVVLLQIAVAVILILVLLTSSAKAAFAGVAATPPLDEEQEKQEQIRSPYEGYEE